MKNKEYKIQAIRRAITYLKKCPKGKRQLKRKPFLRAKHINNAKIFFDIFIPKVLTANTNDQYRRLRYLPRLLRKMFFTKPQKNGNSYIFEYKKYTAIVVEKKKTKKGKEHREHYLLTFFPI